MGVFRIDDAGVDVCRRARAATAPRSAEAATDWRETGRESTGVAGSVLGATEVQQALDGRVGDMEDGSEDKVHDGA